MYRTIAIILLLAAEPQIEIHAQRVVPYAGFMGMGLGVYDMVEFDGSLIFGGHFQSFRGHERRNLQAWNGEYHGDLPGAFEANSSMVFALEVFEDHLYAAGSDVNARSVGRWDGTSWTWIPLNPGVRVNALAIFDGTLICGTSDGRVHELVDGAWSALGQAFNDAVAALTVHEGSLYAAGDFTAQQGSGAAALRLARWNGLTWEQVLSGLNGPVKALVSTPNGLISAGAFTSDGLGELELQGHVRLANEEFHVPPFIEDLGVIEGACLHPLGGYLIGGSETVHMFDGGIQRNSFRGTRACIDYDGSLLLGGSAQGSWSSYKPTGAIGEVLQGDDNTSLAINGIRAKCMPMPHMFRGRGNGLSPRGFEAPRGSNRHTLYFTSPWFMSLNDTLQCSAIPGRYWAPGDSMWTYAGPYADVMDEAHYRHHHQLWKLDRAQVLAHGAHWSSPGYTQPAAISTWPAHGDPTKGEPEHLAPFEDENGDGVYDPAQGDRPAIRGDQAVYWVMHTEEDAIEGTADMKLEIHVQAYGYEGPGNDAIHNTVFVNYRVINRADHVYPDLRFGQFVLFDIGCAVDDRLECDSTRSSFMAYNGDGNDEDCNGMLGHGSKPTAQGVKFLNHRMGSHRHRWPPLPGGPMEVSWDMLNGYSNGVPLHYPGLSTTYEFPGGEHLDTFPLLGSRSSVGAFPAGDLFPGDTLCIDLAFIFAQRYTGAPYSIVEVLKQRSDSVQAFYDAQALDCRSMPTMVAVTERSDPAVLPIHPNPSNGIFWVGDTEALGDLLVLDMQGRGLVRERVATGRHVLDLSQHPAGVYVVMARNERGVQVGKLIKE